ncbi:MAG: hypothetical protein WD940_01150 [Patescibacteria group bacterium]
MIFKRIRKIRTKLVRLGRTVFSWPKIRQGLLAIYPRVLVGVYALFILFSPFAHINTADAPVMAAEDLARIERQKELAELRAELRTFLRRYRSNLGSEYIEAVIGVEERYRMPGFAKLATAVALNESYLGKVYPQGSYNIWGIGASSPDRWIDYDSWKEGATAFYQVVKRLGMSRVNQEELLQISRAYVGTANWRQWGNKIWKFYRKI